MFYPEDRHLHAVIIERLSYRLLVISVHLRRDNVQLYGFNFQLVPDC